MKYIPLVALLLYQNIAIGAEEFPAFKAQVTPHNAPQIILAQEEGEDEDDGDSDDDVTDDDPGCEDLTSKGECEAAGDCTWTEEDGCYADDE
ncbi:MAG: hypothetical protein ACREA0_34690 [bacterium]